MDSVQHAGMRRRPGGEVRVASFPATSGANPYLDLFYQALAPLGVKMVGEARLDAKWLRDNAADIDAVHLHWPEAKWRHTHGKLANAVRGLARSWNLFTLAKRLRIGKLAVKLRGIPSFLRFLIVARRLRIALIWTVHNMGNHEGDTWADLLGYRMIAKRADLLVCHSHSERKAVVARWRPRGRTVVMSYGNVDGLYPDPRPRAVVLEELGLSARKQTLCCVGGIRKYKGLEVAVEALKLLNGEYQLIIAGWVHPAFDAAGLHRMAENAPFIRIVPESLSAQQFSDIVGASTAMLLPYRQITGSSAFMTAMTLGRGVIASDLPFFREVLAGREYAGRVFPVGDDGALAAAIKEYLAVPDRRRQKAARDIADACSWDRVARPLVAAVKDCVLRKGRWETRH